MGLHSYYAIETVLSKDFIHKGWRIKKEKINQIETFFKPYLNDARFVLIPRFSGNYVSFRYSGLEVLQLTKKGEYKITVEIRKGKVRRAQKSKKTEALNNPEFKSLLDSIKCFLGDRIKSPNIFRKRKEERKIPGFGLEHWLESLILADSAGGRDARKHIGINNDLKKVVSQAPVIMKPYPDKEKRRGRHIDLFSVNKDGKIVIVELKKDENIRKAREELTEYTNWLLQKGKDFDPDRGNLQSMIKEHYVPNVSSPMKPENIEAIAVVLEHKNTIEQLPNSISMKIVKLSKDWLLNDDGNPFKEQM